MIFTTITDVKNFIPVNINNDFQTIKPYLISAETDVYPFISRSLYSAIEAEYINDATLAKLPAKLVYHLRSALVHFAYYRYAADGTMQIDDSGFKQVEDDNYKSAHQWQIRTFRAARKTASYTAIQELLLILDKNTTITPPNIDYTNIWKSSPEFAYLKSLLIFNRDTFSQYRQIAGFETLWALRSAMRAADDLLADNITPDLLADIYTHLKNYTTDADIAALLPYVQKFAAHYAVQRGVSELRAEITPNGLYIEADEGGNAANFAKREPASDENFNHLAHAAERFANAAMAALRKYLNANASQTKYADYYSSNLYTAPGTNTPTFKNKEGGIFLAR